MPDRGNGDVPRVLILDDDQLTSLALMKALKDDRFNVFAVADGSSALSEIRSNHYALVFLEIALNDGTGVVVLREISRSSPSTSIIVMSANIPDGEAKDTIIENDHFFMPKPFEILQVKTMTRRILTDASRNRQLVGPMENGRRQKRDTIREPRSGLVSILSDPGRSYPGIPQEMAGQMVDMSSAGMGLRTELPLPPGQIFSFHLNEGTNEGVVRWSMVSESWFRAGIQFLENREWRMKNEE